MSESIPCPCCRYELRRAVGTICPECGTSFDRKAILHAQRFPKTPPLDRALLAATVLGLFASPLLLSAFAASRRVPRPPRPWYQHYEWPQNPQPQVAVVVLALWLVIAVATCIRGKSWNKGLGAVSAFLALMWIREGLHHL